MAATLGRRRSLGSSDPAQVPFEAEVGTGNTVVWDCSTGTIVYFDNGAISGQSPPSTITRGIYRLNPATGANTRIADVPTSVAPAVNGLAVKPDGTIYALFDTVSFGAPQIVQVGPGNTFPRVDGGAGAASAYSLLTSVSWDVFTQRILVFDQGATSAADAKILRINPATGQRTHVSSASSAVFTIGQGNSRATRSPSRRATGRTPARRKASRW